MKIGIVSDSHGQAKRLAAAVAALRTAGAEALVHCGDLGSTECLSVLAEAHVPCYAVAGNMDLHIDGLSEAAAARGVCFHPQFVTVPLGDGRTLAATHGNTGQMRKLVNSGDYAYVCCGHTHKAADIRDGDVRVINPGALYHCRPYTVALLDTVTDELHLLTI